VIAALEGAEPVLCFCRADPRFANVIARPTGRLGLVDWEDCGLRDPARDVADLLTHANQEDIVAPDVWSAFLDPYLAARRPVDPNLDTRVHLYLLLFPVYWLARNLHIGAQRAVEGQLSAWSINEMAPNQRLRRYLARARAWPARDFTRQLYAARSIEFFPGIG
jgi:thiamine kinase-like enzyme